MNRFISKVAIAGMFLGTFLLQGVYGEVSENVLNVVEVVEVECVKKDERVHFVIPRSPARLMQIMADFVSGEIGNKYLEEDLDDIIAYISFTAKLSGADQSDLDEIYFICKGYMTESNTDFEEQQGVRNDFIFENKELAEGFQQQVDFFTGEIQDKCSDEEVLDLIKNMEDAVMMSNLPEGPMKQVIEILFQILQYQKLD